MAIASLIVAIMTYLRQAAELRKRDNDSSTFSKGIEIEVLVYNILLRRDLWSLQDRMKGPTVHYDSVQAEQNTDGSRRVAPRLHSTFADHREWPPDAHPVEPRTLQWSMGVYRVLRIEYRGRSRDHVSWYTTGGITDIDTTGQYVHT